MSKKKEMIQNILRALRDRPILSIILCVVLSEIIQLIITLISKKPPAFHYGMAVMALLVLFVIPVVLYLIDKKNGQKQDDEEKPDQEHDENCL